MDVIKYYPGSIGEIIQGNVAGKDVLLSCPVNLFTKVRVFESHNPTSKEKYPKCKKFMENMMKSWGYGSLCNTFDIEIKSEIPIGKGFASSTADIMALYLSLIELFKKDYKEQEIMKQAIMIEPTDSIIFSEMTLFDYKNGDFKESIGNYMEFYVFVFEGPRIVDTIEFNQKIESPLAFIDDLLPELKKAVKERNIYKLANISHQSIVRNHHRLHYDILPSIEKIIEKTDGLGIIGAHSGDFLGIIYEDELSMQAALHYKDSIPLYKGYPLMAINKYDK